MSPLGYVLRRMHRAPGFTAMVVVTIALAIGVILGIFSIMRALLFYPTGVPDAERIVYYTLGNGPDSRPVFSVPGYEALRANGAVKDLLAWKILPFRVQNQFETGKVLGALVTGNTFSVLGLKPFMGRFFNESDDTHGGGKDGWTAVLGYDYWRTQFEAEPNIVGQTILVNGIPVRIVGVLPREFTRIVALVPVTILLPRYFVETAGQKGEDFTSAGNISWFVLGRLSNGLSIEQVRANLKVIEPLFRQQADPENMLFRSELFRNTPAGTLLNVQGGRHGAVSGQSPIPAVVMFGALAASVFVCCCSNLILLLVGRGRREAGTAAIRVALGARLEDNVHLAVLEAALLVSVGCLAGVLTALAVVGIFSLVVQSIYGVGLFSLATPSWATIAFTAVISLVVGCGTALCVNLLRARDWSSINPQGESGVKSSRLSNWMIGFEVLACIFLTSIVAVDGIGVLKLTGQPSGFPASTAATATLDFEGPSKNEKTARVLQELEADSRVYATATLNMPPLSGATASLTVTARHQDGALHQQRVWPAVVSLRYFSAIGTPIVSGRDFVAADLSGDPVCVIGRRAASAMFPRIEPVGQILYRVGGAGKAEAPAVYCRVVGVAGDAHFQSMSEPADVVVYLLSKEEMATIVVRAASAPLAVEAVRAALKSVDPASRSIGVFTIKSIIERDLRLWRVLVFASGFCACLAGSVLAVGFFGIVSLQVSQRRRDIGIQIALGARWNDVCRLLFRKLLLSVAVGLTVGSALALIASTVLARLYGLDRRFIAEGYVCSVALLLILLLVASWTPVRRALAVPPMDCLRYE